VLRANEQLPQGKPNKGDRASHQMDVIPQPRTSVLWNCVHPAQGRQNFDKNYDSNNVNDKSEWWKEDNVGAAF
jgi:hypothetical protein